MILMFGILLIVSFNAYCADANNLSLEEQVRYKEEIVHTLKEEIKQIDDEMARCEKTKKSWVAATVIGGVGVAATGTAAIVQSVNANKKQQESNATKAK